MDRLEEEDHILHGGCLQRAVVKLSGRLCYVNNKPLPRKRSKKGPFLENLKTRARNTISDDDEFARLGYKQTNETIITHFVKNRSLKTS